MEKLRGVRFDPEGQDIFNTWRTELEAKIREPDIHPALESHLTKYRSLMPSLALIIDMAECESLAKVSGVAAVKAVAWCKYLETHANRIYGAAVNPAVHGAATILKRRDKLPAQVRARDIRDKGWSGLSDTGSIKAAFRELEESGYIRRLKKETGGRPSEVYEWNPII